ncbi:MAG: DUF5667 domain-containing protein [bacterium]|nr:DUF5667 domain-containing protein [bacterium]
MRFIYTSIVSLSLLAFMIGGQATAQDVSSDAGTEPVVSEEDTVSLEDLDAGDPRILPTSPFYFFKELVRGAQRVLTFDSIDKAELELKITNEKAAEVKKVQDTEGQNAGAVQKAVENYQKAQEALRSRLEKLQETSENPKIDTLLDRLTERTLKHQKLLDDIAAKADTEEVKTIIRNTKEKIEETTGTAIGKDDVAKFVSRLEKALVEGKGGDLKNLRSLEAIERIADKAPEAAKASLERLREDFSERAKASIEEVSKRSPEALKKALEKLPGDDVHRSIILEQIQGTLGDRAKEALRENSLRLQGKVMDDEKGLMERAAEQIKRVTEIVQKLEGKIAERTSAATSTDSLAEQARAHLAKANEAFAAQQYGEAFGQGRSAEVIARNALQKLEESRTPSGEDVKGHIEELAAKISRYEGVVTSLREEFQEKGQSLLALAKEHLGYARDAFSKNDLVTAKTHIEHVKGYLADLARLVQQSNKQSTVSPENTSVKPVQRTTEKTNVVCTKEYNPVCGADSKTYSNTCEASSNGMKIVSKGECKDSSTDMNSVESGIRKMLQPKATTE